MSVVYFSSLKIKKIEAEQTLPAKFRRILDRINLNTLVKGKKVVIKMHLGGAIGYTTIHPVFVRTLVEKVKAAGASNVIVTDGFTRDVELRGYTPKSVGCEIEPLFVTEEENEYVTVPINFESLDEAKMSKKIIDSDVLLVFSHIKGHGAAAFGGAGKNIAMGCVPRETRRKTHALAGGINWDGEKCIKCNKCIEECPNSANKFNEEDNYEIFYHNCTYCRHCVLACEEGALTTIDEDINKFQRGMAKVISKVIEKMGIENVYYFNLLTNITIFCDCWGISTASLVPDIGIMASNDIVSIDRASLDMIKTEDLLPNGMPENRELGEGKHLFEKIHGKDPYFLGEKLSELKLGSIEYRIIEVE